METSQETRAKIIALHTEGHSKAYIARRLAISPHTVTRWVRRFTDSGNTKDQPRCGRTRCTTQEQDRAIINAYDADPFTPTTSVLSTYDLRCTTQTMRNRLHGSGLHGRSPARKLELTDRTMELRMEYALNYSDRDEDFWNMVIFCDEKTFSSDNEWSSWVWRSEKTR